MNNYVAGLIILFFLAGGSYSLYRTRLMETRSRFTVGYLTGGIYSVGGGKRYGYRFSVGGRPYEDTDLSEPHQAVADGSRFLVEYDRLDPEVSTGHFAVAVPDSVRDIPAAGWAAPPFPVPASLLRRRTP